MVTEIRGWLMLGLGVIGGVVALLTYSRGQNQRRLENSFRMIQLFRDSIPTQDFEQWIKLFHAASEPAGAKPGHFVSEDGRQIPFSALYTEGPPDDGAIDRIAQVLDLVSEQALKRTLDLRIFYHEYGQLMDTIHSWLSADVGSDGRSLLEDLYPNFRLLYEKNKIVTDWNCRRYVYCGQQQGF
ncbi:MULTISPECIES: hypothetical protein [unclassified Marinimicrobium]|uniref:hypothetical protein n=1 Tax=unclassified Marinimicrobium TaxID=2632100 RepID=UPI000C506ADC|nr:MULTISPECIES: hypothetical protein [unclassified Marinimicrobium]MAN53213.1 hypothetical protein [Marinimicrobium sp.]